MKTPLLAFFCLVSLASFSQIRNWNQIGTEGIVSQDSTTKKGYTLVFISKDSAFSEVTKKKMTDAFFTVYPKEAKRFNKKVMKRVIFLVDPAYKGVAATSGGIVRYSPKWMAEHPEDIDVVTHEVMHIVQGYPGGAGPGWLTEGIADYVRYIYGVNNEAGKWSLPNYDASHAYTKSYRVTARFLVWLEKNKKKNMVTKLDGAMRSKTYSADLWKELTGKTLDELWSEYASNPVI